mgnify:CR=1 FL=1
MTVQRGDVVIVDFDELEAASMTKQRPAVVIQNNVANRLAGHTIVAAVRNDGGKRLPVQVPLPAGTGGLRKDSLADLGHLSTLPLGDIKGVIGRLTPEMMLQVDTALKVSLALR